MLDPSSTSSLDCSLLMFFLCFHIGTIHGKWQSFLLVSSKSSWILVFILLSGYDIILNEKLRRRRGYSRADEKTEISVERVRIILLATPSNGMYYSRIAAMWCIVQNSVWRVQTFREVLEQAETHFNKPSAKARSWVWSAVAHEGIPQPYKMWLKDAWMYFTLKKIS